MAEQRLLDLEETVSVPYVASSPTSRAAADEAVPTAGTERRRVWDFFESRGDYGATDEEAQEALGMNPSTERPRRVELVQRKLIEDSGRRRETRAGRKAVVWVRG